MCAFYWVHKRTEWGVACATKCYNAGLPESGANRYKA